MYVGMYVSASDEAFKVNCKIKVKLSGDGTNVGKQLHVINITFTPLNEGAKAMAADGNHLTTIIKVSENYESLSVALQHIRKDMESLSHISVGSANFQIEWFLGGDWKFLACICGLGAANANNPCIWCKCPLYDKYDQNKEWSLSDPSKGARTIKEIEETSKKKLRADQRFNVKHVPLFPTIPLDHIFSDSLHLFLRISDNLINILILELRQRDAILTP